MEKEGMPRTFEELFPAVAKAQFETIKECDAWGPLDAKTSHLIKLAYAVALGSENAVKAMVGRAKILGIDGDQLRHTILLGLGMLGYPPTVAALAWTHPMVGEPALR